MDITAQREYMCIPLRIGFYAIALTAYRQEHIVYGRTNCDYSDGTLLFFAPGDVFHIDHPDFLSNITLLVFHKDLIEGLSLGLHIGDYSFFDYYKQEALHLSCREKTLILQHFEDIQNELGRPIDRHSRVLLCKNNCCWIIACVFMNGNSFFGKTRFGIYCRNPIKCWMNISRRRELRAWGFLRLPIVRSNSDIPKHIYSMG